MSLVARLLGSRIFSRSVSAQVIRALDEARSARHADFDLLRLYYDRDGDEPRDDGIDDRTWADLNLDDVFLKLDFAVSEPGRQVLYDLLRRPRQSEPPLETLERDVERCAPNAELAERIRAALGPLGDRRSAFLVHLFYGELPARPRFWWVFPLLTVASIGCLVASFAWPRALIPWIVICAVNICAQLAYKPRVKRFIPAIHEIPKFLGAGEKLAAIVADELPHDAASLRAGVSELRALRPATRWLTFEPDQANELASSVYEYVNLLFLLDVTAFVFSIETLRQKRGAARAMFLALGRLDALQSIATWRPTLATWTRPEFTPGQKSLDVKGIVHPLLAEPVANSLEIRRAGILISGSNMSGKTTFVRTLGVNAVLAQTLNTACARQWVAPLLRVRTFIGRADSLAEGKSYYLAEAESILSLIRAKDPSTQHLFLLDEIFRGTNTTERIAAASAVLRHLNGGNDLVVVATHDLELLELLGGAYEALHFTEQINEQGLSFDYRIRPGASSTRNAIALLEFMGYPSEVIADAVAKLAWQGSLVSSRTE